jgi:hypothetical protein
MRRPSYRRVYVLLVCSYLLLVLAVLGVVDLFVALNKSVVQLVVVQVDSGETWKGSIVNTFPASKGTSLLPAGGASPTTGSNSNARPYDYLMIAIQCRSIGWPLVVWRKWSIQASNIDPRLPPPAVQAGVASVQGAIEAGTLQWPKELARSQSAAHTSVLSGVANIVIITAIIACPGIVIESVQRLRQRRRNSLRGRCPGCGYLLEGLRHSVCPECGARVRRTVVRRGGS